MARNASWRLLSDGNEEDSESKDSGKIAHQVVVDLMLLSQVPQAQGQAMQVIHVPQHLHSNTSRTTTVHTGLLPHTTL